MSDGADLPSCGECGHPADWHRLDDSTNVSPVDPAAEFRCIGYDCTIDGPIGICGYGCADYREDGAVTQMRRAFTRIILQNSDPCECENYSGRENGRCERCGGTL